MRGAFYIICYDTPSDKRRRKLYKLLKNYAVSVQKSVFETFLDSTNFDKMMAKITKIMDPAVDSVRVYGLSRAAQKRMKVIGWPGILVEPHHYYVDDPTNKESQNFDDDLEDTNDLPDWL